VEGGWRGGAAATGSDVTYTSELVGTITSAYTFEGMADFQFAGDPPPDPDLDLLDPQFFTSDDSLRLVRCSSLSVATNPP
jgi:hypothetical protein